MKKIKIVAQINEDEVGFSIQKSNDMSLVEILGLLKVITNEVMETLQNKIKISKN